MALPYARLLNAVSAVFVVFSYVSSLNVWAADTPPAVQSSVVVVNASVIGEWEGVLVAAPMMEMTLHFSVGASPNGASGEMTAKCILVIPGRMEVPFDEAIQKGDSVRLASVKFDGVFEGTLCADGSEIRGVWKQRGAAAPLNLKRSVALSPAKPLPQVPVRPFPYVEEEVSIENIAGQVTLFGTLTKPSAGGRFPLVILLNGSGPQTRDAIDSGHPLFLVLSDYLTRCGLAVLRCDDRGVGKSTGTLRNATFNEIETDAEAMLTFAKGRSDIDAERIGFVGHSEGAMIAMKIAARRNDLGFIVLLAGPGRPLDEILVRQFTDFAIADGYPADVMNRHVETLSQAYRIGLANTDAAKAKDEIQQLYDRFYSTLTTQEKEAARFNQRFVEWVKQRVTNPYVRVGIEQPPAKYLPSVHCPVLALNGGKDLVVEPNANSNAIREALQQGGNRRIDLRILPGLNHYFQRCEIGTYAENGKLEETFNPDALQAISDWMREVVRP